MTTTEHTIPTYCQDCGKRIQRVDSPTGGEYCTCLDDPAVSIEKSAPAFDPERSHLHFEQVKGEWHFTTEALMTDEQAAALTFRADAAKVRLGAFVQVTDAGGTRIGHLASATYHRGSYFGPDYVNCSIELI